MTYPINQSTRDELESYIAELEAERDRLAGYIDRAEDSIFAAMAPSGWGRSTHEHHASRVTTLSNLYLGLAAENALLRKALREQWETNHWEHCGKGVDAPLPHAGLCHWPLPDILKDDEALAGIPEAGK